MRKLNCYICDHCRKVLWNGSMDSVPALMKGRARHYCTDEGSPDCRKAQDDVWDKPEEPDDEDVTRLGVNLIADNVTDPEPDTAPSEDWSGEGGESGGGGASESWDGDDAA